MSSSRIGKNEIIIDDEPGWEIRSHFGNARKGLALNRRPNTDDYAYEGFAAPAEDDLRIERHEWQARVEEIEEQEAQISDQIRYHKLQTYSQGSTNYCWIFAVVNSMRVAMMQQNQKPIDLSPSWAGSIIKGGRNSGGWGLEAIKFLSQHGTVPTSVCGLLDRSRRHDTQHNRNIAKQYRVIDWRESKPRDFDMTYSMLLRRKSSPIGLMWWEHEVLACDPLWMDGEPAIRIWNSWGPNWSDGGFGILRGSRMIPDDTVSCFSASLTQDSQLTLPFPGDTD